MEKTATLKGRDVAPQAREWLRQLFRIDFADCDEFTVTLRHLPCVPTADEKRKAIEGMNAFLDQMAENMKDVPEEEFNAALDEAMKSVRPTYEPMR